MDWVWEGPVGFVGPWGTGSGATAQFRLAPGSHFLPVGPQAWLLLLPGPLLPCRVALHASRLPGCQLRPIPGRQVSPLPTSWEEGAGRRPELGTHNRLAHSIIRLDHPQLHLGPQIPWAVPPPTLIRSLHFTLSLTALWFSLGLSPPILLFLSSLCLHFPVCLSLCFSASSLCLSISVCVSLLFCMFVFLPLLCVSVHLSLPPFPVSLPSLLTMVTLSLFCFSPFSPTLASFPCPCLPAG